MRELERRGAHVAHDWVAELRRAGCRVPEDHEERKAHATADLLGVARADAVLGLLGLPSVGRCHEMGAALMRLVRGEVVRVLTSGDRPEPDIWDARCEHHATDLDAVRKLTRDLPATVPTVERAAALCRTAAEREVWPSRAPLVEMVDALADHARRRHTQATSGALSATLAATEKVLSHWSGGMRDAQAAHVISLIDEAARLLSEDCYIR
jgi:hypothetical protein